jgi:ATP-dependent DNA helicase DinG
VPPGRVETLALDSPFNFKRQALLAIATDLPEPNDRSFLEASVEGVRAALRASHGHAFVLFTSFYALDYTHSRLADELREAGITPLRQGQTNRTQLLDQFRGDMSSVLFATDSFWEGVDVAGESLRCVILPKLPFRVPTEPVLEARAEAIEAAGGNAFTEYSVPQAVIKFRQGFGRLIRRRTDRGVIVVLDRRIVSKFYGRVFLRSLPDVRIVRGPGQEVYSALEEFFSPDETQ